MQNNIVHTFIKEDYGLLDRPNRQNFWIGITDREVEGQFLYESSGTPLAFQYWGGSHHEPNGGPNENCLGYYSDWYQHGELNDLACSTITNFVCEKKFDFGKIYFKRDKSFRTLAFQALALAFHAESGKITLFRRNERESSPLKMLNILLIFKRERSSTRFYISLFFVARSHLSSNRALKIS